MVRRECALCMGEQYPMQMALRGSCEFILCMATGDGTFDWCMGKGGLLTTCMSVAFLGLRREVAIKLAKRPDLGFDLGPTLGRNIGFCWA